ANLRLRVQRLITACDFSGSAQPRCALLGDHLMQKPFARLVGGQNASTSIALRDVIALAKPRITLMVLITAAGGLFLPGRRLAAAPTATAVACTLVGLALIVAGANALNMYLERDIDRRMARTKNRPLPAGRMPSRFALWFGVVLS